MAWVFMFGILYGLLLVLNIKLCQFKEFGVMGSIVGVVMSAVASVIALGGNNGPAISTQDWLLPFIAICFFFMPNHITSVKIILDRKGD